MFQTLTVVSLALGALGLLPWLVALMANVMALASMEMSGPMDPVTTSVMYAFIAATTVWPAAWVASMFLALRARGAANHGRAFGFSLLWVAWLGVCVVLGAVWGVV